MKAVIRVDLNSLVKGENNVEKEGESLLKNILTFCTDIRVIQIENSLCLDNQETFC